MEKIANNTPSASTALDSSSTVGESRKDTQSRGRPECPNTHSPTDSQTQAGHPTPSVLPEAFVDNSWSPPRVDVESVTDVISRLDRLNSQVEELSLLVFEWDTVQPQRPREVTPAAHMKILKLIVHPSIILQLEEGSITNDSTMALLRFAWEIILCHCVINIIPLPSPSSKNASFFGRELNGNQIAHMALTRWKGDTFPHAIRGSTRLEQLQRSIAEGSGLSRLSLEAASLCYSCACLPNHPNTPERFQFTLELSSRILELLSDAEQLDTIIHDGIVSQDLYLSCPGTNKEVLPSEVTLEEGLQVEVSSPGNVLGVTQIGITRITSTETHYLRKATVVSEGVLWHLREIADQDQRPAPQVPVSRPPLSRILREAAFHDYHPIAAMRRKIHTWL